MGMKMDPWTIQACLEEKILGLIAPVLRMGREGNLPRAQGGSRERSYQGLSVSDWPRLNTNLLLQKRPDGTKRGVLDTCSVLAEEREKQVEHFANREKGGKKRALILLCPGCRYFPTQTVPGASPPKIPTSTTAETWDFPWKEISEHWNMPHFQH